MKPIGITELFNYINSLIKTDPLLTQISVEGEITEIRINNQQTYFNISDGKSILECIIFNRSQLSYEGDLEVGLHVVINGNLLVYPKKSRIELVVRSIEAQGAGLLSNKFKQLVEDLAKQGYFDAKSKKKIPQYPESIGVLTSHRGAAIKDILSVLERRWPLANVVAYHTQVQGLHSVEEITQGITYLDQLSLDVIIIARGGGSNEDLSVFNDKIIAEAIFKAGTPIISAIGHEIDYSVADLVADKRVATPTEAAEVATPLLDTVKRDLDEKYLRIHQVIEERLHLETLTSTLKYNRFENNNPIDQINGYKTDLAHFYKYLKYYTNKIYLENRKNIDFIEIKLQNFNQQKTLDQGYTLILDENRNIVSSLKGLNEKEFVYIRFADGEGKYKFELVDEEL